MHKGGRTYKIQETMKEIRRSLLRRTDEGIRLCVCCTFDKTACACFLIVRVSMGLSTPVKLTGGRGENMSTVSDWCKVFGKKFLTFLGD